MGYDVGVGRASAQKPTDETAVLCFAHLFNALSFVLTASEIAKPIARQRRLASLSWNAGTIVFSVTRDRP